MREQLEVQGNQEEGGLSPSKLSSPSFAKSPHPVFEEWIMAEDCPLRMTLKDYSSSTISQYFTSIARLEVQAANISYPHSLIQLIHGNLFHGLPSKDPYAHMVHLEAFRDLGQSGGYAWGVAALVHMYDQ